MKFNVVFSISEGMVKFLQVYGKGKKCVTAAGMINTAGQSDAQISQSLRGFIKQRKLNFFESRVTLVVPRSRVILRHMVFPSKRPDEIRSMIDLQVGNSIPYSREEVEVDFQILSKTADGYTKVAVVIIPQEIAARYWKIFSDSRIPVHGMTISSIGLWLLYCQQPDAADMLGAIIDLDLETSEICLCCKAHWLTSREIPVGLAQMRQDGYAEILRQWELTQINTGDDQLAGPFGPVYLVSSTNQSHALALEMTKMRQDLAVKEICLTQALGASRGLSWPKLMTDDGISVASLAGIAFSPADPPIDLMPGSVRQDQERRSYQHQLVILGVWAAIALISLGLALGMGFFKKHFQLGRLQEQLHEIKPNAFIVEEELRKINDIQGLIKGRLIFGDLANGIGRLLPSQVYLVSIAISEGKTLSLQGASSNPVEINRFQKAMADAPGFLNVSLDYVNKQVTPQGEVDFFKITCTLK